MRISDGSSDVCSSDLLAAPGHRDSNGVQGTAYVRPHDIEIDRYKPDAQGIVVQLERFHAIGPLAQLEPKRADTSERIEAVISAERFSQLQLKENETSIEIGRESCRERVWQ